MSERCLQRCCCCPGDCSSSVADMWLFLLQFIFNRAGIQQLLHHRRAALTRSSELYQYSHKNTNFSWLLKGALGTSREDFPVQIPPRSQSKTTTQCQWILPVDFLETGLQMISPVPLSSFMPPSTASESLQWEHCIVWHAGISALKCSLFFSWFWEELKRTNTPYGVCLWIVAFDILKGRVRFWSSTIFGWMESSQSASLHSEAMLTTVF